MHAFHTPPYRRLSICRLTGVLLSLCISASLMQWPGLIHAQAPLQAQLATRKLCSPRNQILAKRGPFSRADSLRGVLSPQRLAMDVTYYDLQIRVNPGARRISGWNEVTVRIVQPTRELQFDLFANLELDSVLVDGKRRPTRREFNTFWVELDSTAQPGTQLKTKIWYNGQPRPAVNPPWDGGFVWRRDSSGKPWVTVACEGLGASVWWPLKDHPSDEPDSMRIAIETPPGLSCVANGELRGIVYLQDGFSRYDWHVSYPINSYNVTLNIADYSHFSEVYESRTEGLLQLDYYVLRGNEKAAKEHFKQVKTMLRCFEERLGPYPFWRDGYALVETPYWGMEHQGAIAYGNKYKNNNFGFDFIIIHESGHEWFGNLISAADHADLWMHEAFCTYTEFLYLECSTGYARALEYLNNQRNYVRNTDAVLGPLNVNFNNWDNSDMYYKGTWLIHTLRRAMADDTRFLRAMREMGNHFGLKPTNTDAIVEYWNQATGRDWTPVFAQYLCQVDLPVLQYTFVRDVQVPGQFRFKYRWKCSEERFNLPVKALIGSDTYTLSATTTWQTLPGTFAAPVPVTYTETDFLGKVEFIPLIQVKSTKPKRTKSARH